MASESLEGSCLNIESDFVCDNKTGINTRNDYKKDGRNVYILLWNIGRWNRQNSNGSFDGFDNNWNLKSIDFIPDARIVNKLFLILQIINYYNLPALPLTTQQSTSNHSFSSNPKSEIPNPKSLVGTQVLNIIINFLLDIKSSLSFT